MRHRTALCAILAYAAACADPAGPGAQGPTAPERDLMILATPSFAIDIQDIIDRNGCSYSGCHALGQAGLTLTGDPAANYLELVGVRAETEREYLRVEPYDPDSSYVVIKLEGRQRLGSPMPPGLPIDSIDLTNFRNWIELGAPNN